ncbi:hypothetical protein ASPVEDRAFT_86158 [Aspergillus versicolor CBS 583.65]|uniref:Uncharacterized protein n=1 Tax=Aspergillus versicolor CBS 583.65 TaxID=1036611 RepID=A0A1L9PTK3_ASPVE|nr:uncharacterized protein ASPVEDRAFT_86158 [Aspergillus versicolor CBS 583.65]OJJ04776.1 hypothetical protein ASPVEDRAFT_86158 [Aspergillus versicolor CBS 583.65]
MGAVFSCIADLFRSIGACIMGVVNAIATGIKVVINGIVSVLGVLVSCLTCGYCGRRRRGTRGMHHRSRAVY